jgi:pimeloyl-ACP methyl ester carboxylesterase/ketosteroid isomerase-like protein
MLTKGSTMSQPEHRMKRTFFSHGWKLALLAVLAGAPALAITDAPDIGPPPGHLIDVGGFRLHLHCVGEGTPTVIIDVGAGAWSMFFSHIQAAAAQRTRVCTYDRAGLGWSDPGPRPRTSSRMVDELHLLLHRSGINPPIVLVGHSLGGYNIRIYQARYPEEVAALVFLDSAHEAQWQRLPPQALQLLTAAVPRLRARAQQARQGKLAAEDITPAGVFTTHASSLLPLYVAAMRTPKPYEGLADESEAAVDSAAQVPAGQSLGDLPVVVLTARNSFAAFAGSPIPQDEADRVWMDLQRELASLSRDTVHLFSEQGHHRLHETDPEAVIAAIGRGVELVRTRPQPPSALGAPPHALPLTSTAVVDRLLRQLEEAYRRMDVDRFVALFTDDVAQLDVNRRVHVKGRAAWEDWTRQINAAHRRMERQHRGRAIVGDWVIAEIEWSGLVRGEAVGSPGRDREYRYTGLGLIRVKEGKVAQQILYGDYATLSEQLGASPVGR